MMTDAQKIILHLCMEADKRGRNAAWITRQSMMDGKTVPVPAGVRLVWAALTMPENVLEWSADGQSFRLTTGAIASISSRRAARHAA